MLCVGYDRINVRKDGWIYVDRLGQRISSMEKKKSSEEDSTISHSCTKSISLFLLLGKSGLSLPQPRPRFPIYKYDT